MTDRAVLRWLKRKGLDVEAVRASLAKQPQSAAASVEIRQLDKRGLRYTLREVRILTIDLIGDR